MVPHRGRPADPELDRESAISASSPVNASNVHFGTFGDLAGWASAVGKAVDERRSRMGLGRGVLLWLIGVPIPIILLVALLWHH
jgi:hypothetical protein